MAVLVVRVLQCRHPAYSDFRLHRLLKLVVFKLFNTMSLFIVRYYAGDDDTSVIMLTLILSSYACSAKTSVLSENIVRYW